MLTFISTYIFQEMCQAMRDKNQYDMVPDLKKTSQAIGKCKHSSILCSLVWQMQAQWLAAKNRAVHLRPGWSRETAEGAALGGAWVTGFPSSGCKLGKHRHCCVKKRSILGSKYTLFLWWWAEFKEMRLEKTIPKPCQVNEILDFNLESIMTYRSISSKN